MGESGLVQLRQMPTSATQVSSSNEPGHVSGPPGPQAGGSLTCWASFPGNNEKAAVECGVPQNSYLRYSFVSRSLPYQYPSLLGLKKVVRPWCALAFGVFVLLQS